MSKASVWIFSGLAIVLAPGFLWPHSFGRFSLVIMIIGAAVVFVGFFKHAAQAERKQRAVEKAFQDGFTYWFEQNGDGIAISPERRTLKLQKGGLTGNIAKEYAFDDVRRWHTNKSTGGEIAVAVGLQASFLALGHNVRNASKNRRESGFYVCVRDIDNPEWRIDMQNVANQKKWMEILEQHINEGRMSPAHRDVDAIVNQ